MRGSGRVMRGKAFEGVADRPRDARAGALGAAASGALPSAQPYGTSELGDEKVAVALGQLRPCRIVEPDGLLDVLLDLCETSSIGLPGLVVEHREAGTHGFSHVDQSVLDRGRRPSGGGSRRSAPLERDQVERVE